MGLPPADLLEDVEDALRVAGFDVVDSFRRAVSVTGDFIYNPQGGECIRDRIKPKHQTERTIPVRLRTLKQCLDPQPKARDVIHKLLDWIDRCDQASQRGVQRPTFVTVEGESIFPEDEDNKWWLTELQRRSDEEEEPPPGDEDGPPSEDLVDEAGDMTDDEETSSSDVDAKLNSNVVG